MKKMILAIALLTLCCMGVFAQVTAPEPEFINSYCILTSDSTFDILPKEGGTLGKHVNKARKITKLIGGAASVVGAAGFVGVHTAGSFNGIRNGVRVMGSAAGVSSIAGTVNGLAGSSGMDVIFKGGTSSYAIQGGQDVRLLIRGADNETDPMDSYRIVRFKSSKKERRIQWMEFDSSLIGSDETKKAGYVQFIGHKYGEQSYLLTIPSPELQPGEYGIFYMSIITASAIPVGTFSVK